MVIVAEGALDLDLDKITPLKIQDLLSKKLKLDTKITTLGHVQRGGHPCAYDRLLSTLQGVEAVKTVLGAKAGDPSQFIAIIENKIARKPLIEGRFYRIISAQAATLRILQPSVWSSRC